MMLTCAVSCCAAWFVCKSVCKHSSPADVRFTRQSGRTQREALRPLLTLYGHQFRRERTPAPLGALGVSAPPESLGCSIRLTRNFPWLVFANGGELAPRSGVMARSHCTIARQSSQSNSFKESRSKACLCTSASALSGRPALSQHARTLSSVSFSI